MAMAGASGAGKKFVEAGILAFSRGGGQKAGKNCLRLFTSATKDSEVLSAIVQQRRGMHWGSTTGGVTGNGSNRTRQLGSGVLFAASSSSSGQLHQAQQTGGRRTFFTFADPSADSMERINRVRQQVETPDDDENFPGAETLRKNQGSLADAAKDFSTRQEQFIAKSLLYQMSPWKPGHFDQPLRESGYHKRLTLPIDSTDPHEQIRNKSFIRAQKEALASFEADIAQIRKNAKGNEKEFSRELYNYFINNSDHLNKNMLSTLLTEFWNLGEYDFCVELVDNSMRQEFKSDPETMIRYIRAQLKSNYFNMERAEGMTKLLMERGETGAEVQAILGTIHAIKMNAAAKLMEIDEMNIPDSEKLQLKMKALESFRKCFPEMKEVDLSPANLKQIWTANNEKSKAHFMLAWQTSRDPRYGVRVLHRLLEAGRADEAKILADHIQLACLRDGVDNPSQKNQALTRAMLEAILLQDTPSIDKTGTDVSTLKLRLLSSCDTPAKTQHSIISLENFARIFPGNKEVQSTISMLKEHKTELERSGNFQKVMEELKKSRPQVHSSTTDNFEDFATTYRPYFGWNFWSGNTRFGGQLTDHCVHKRDIAFFNKMLKIRLIDLPFVTDGLSNPYQTLGDIDDPKELSKIADLIIRYAFKTDHGKEKLNSPEHKVFDEKVIALFWYLGAPTPELRKDLPDTYTNIAFSLATGLGDCRHQAQVKQLLFDMWQRAKVNQWIEKIEQIDNMDPKNVTDQLKAKRQDYVNLIKENLKTQMRVVHTEVHVPVKTDGGLPVWKGDSLVKGPDTKRVEEHTLNVLVHYDDNGNIEDLELADSFYWETYPFQSGRIDGEGFASDMRVEVAKIKVFDPDSDKLVEVPVYLKPTPWSKGIDSTYKPGTTPAFMGMPVPESDLFSDPKHLDKSLARSDEALRKLRAAYLRDNPPAKTG